MSTVVINSLQIIRIKFLKKRRIRCRATHIPEEYIQNVCLQFLKFSLVVMVQITKFESLQVPIWPRFRSIGFSSWFHVLKNLRGFKLHIKIPSTIGVFMSLMKSCWRDKMLMIHHGGAVDLMLKSYQTYVFWMMHMILLVRIFEWL